MAKLADARDLKSRGEESPCGFDPRLGHSYPSLPMLNGYGIPEISVASRGLKKLLICGRAKGFMPFSTRKRRRQVRCLALTQGISCRGYLMQIDRHFRVADRASKRASKRQAGLSPWLPWIIAPLFTLLPIVGCWLASSFQEPQDIILRHPPAAKSVPSTATVVTVARHNEAF